MTIDGKTHRPGDCLAELGGILDGPSEAAPASVMLPPDGRDLPDAQLDRLAEMIFSDLRFGVSRAQDSG